MDYDVIVIGCGMAGLTAALYTTRAGLKTAVFGEIENSMATKAENIGNYIGSDKMSGTKLLKKGTGQVKRYGATVVKKDIIHASKDEKTFTVKTGDGKLHTTKALVIASGVMLKPSGIMGEETFIGKGVHTCVACDGYFYKDKRIAVIGSGNYAAEEAIQLLSLTSNITMISNSDKFEISPEFMKQISGKIAMINERVSEFAGDKFLKELVMDSGKRLQFAGAFLALGTATSLAFSEKLGLEKNGSLIVADAEGKTSLEGVFAAGACIGGNLQIAKSVGDGCNAGISAIKFLKGLDNYTDQS